MRVLTQVYDDDNNGEPDLSPLARLIEDAESYVNGFLRRNYVLPLTVVPN